MKFTIRIISILFLISLLNSCYNKELRGTIKKSHDKATYLIIEEGCGRYNEILVDGKVWLYEIGEKGKITPGDHTLTCGGKLSIVIKEGTVYHFDYWGGP